MARGSLPPEQGRELRTYLRALRERSGSDLLLLVGEGGGVIAAAGSPGSIDPNVLASLALAHHAALRRLASLLGAFEFTTLRQLGRGGALFLRELRGGWLLIGVAPAIGIGEGVSLGRGGLLEEGIEELEGIVQVREDADALPHDRVGGEWIRAAESEIDRLFREGAF